MVSKSHIRGHAVEWGPETGGWVYSDTKESCNENPRPCIRCGHWPTDEGHDHCIGHIEGALSACCGHGEHIPIHLKEENDG